ncbi:hypothetical protein Hdeb2414_s0017g00505441 [Helianthus debilis subsp. tardiflorus]
MWICESGLETKNQRNWSNLSFCNTPKNEWKWKGTELNNTFYSILTFKR